MAKRCGDRARFWAGVIAQYDGERESVRDYCGRLGIGEHSFYWWRRELRRRRGRESAPLFQPVAMRGCAAGGGVAIELRLRGGRRLRVRPGFDAATLRQLLRLLEAPPEPGESSC